MFQVYDADFIERNVPYETSEDMACHQQNTLPAEKPVVLSRLPKPRRDTTSQYIPNADERMGSGRGYGRSTGCSGGNEGPSLYSVPNSTPTAWMYVPIPPNHSGMDYFNVPGGVPIGGCPGNWPFLPAANNPNGIQNQDEPLQSNQNSNATLSTSIKEESLKRRERRANKREADETARRRESSGLRPFVVEVKADGLIDSCCSGHLKWQENIRDVTPRILDMSVIRYDDQNDSSKSRLRDALRCKFEFVGNEVSDKSLDTMIKTWLRKDRERVKRIHGGKSEAPLRYTPKQWDSMKNYWDSPSSKMMSDKMAETRKKVQNNPRVGRNGYAGKKAKLVGI